MNSETLTKLFRTLGARNPESWAQSQISEDIPQLERFLFLRQAWRLVVPEDDPSWIDRWISQAEVAPEEPYTGGGHALKKLRARGATDDEVTDLVRAMQAELLFGFCQLLEDPGDLEPEVSDVAWSLFRIDANFNPSEPVNGLHESVLETDPTGREMRPR